ncbi:MAG TPA: GDP-mannose 4,6-dehydratase, partial [Candidatus Brocadiia bacterium]|nr:GDP-mannose 4,6-dehydratase [Candidatus Brocadiia bacterium]
DRLVAEGEDAVCWDDFNDYYSPRVKRSNIAHLVESRKIRLYEGDICDEKLGAEIFAKEEITAIVHLAARAGVRHSLEAPLLYERVNCFGTTHLLELARKSGVKKFVFGSTSSAYGKTERLPFREDDPADAQVSPYAASKRAAEILCRTWHEIYGLSIMCCRFFTVYGPRGRPDMAVYLFTDAMVHDRPINMFGDGTTRRDYTYVDDIVQGLVGALRAEYKYEIVNLAESRTVELRYLIDLIAKATGKTPKINQMPLHPGDMIATFADISKARRLLGYNPSFPIEEGIPRFYAWYRRTILGQP